MEASKPNLAQDIVRIHKVISRSLEVGVNRGTEYLKERFQSEQELTGYANYVHCLAEVLGSHHTSEDQITFPELQRVLPWAPYDRFATDHHHVEELLATLRPAIGNLSGEAAGEGPKEIVEILEKISEVWFPHM
jgi:iron-sulfur cluster repair protein YtfE (RIC family)